MKNEVVANVQILRFVAATLVLIGHAQHEAQDLAIGAFTLWIPVPWPFGVDIFFVISGFVMAHTCVGSFQKPGIFGEFLKRRWLRVAPLYWIFTSLTVVTALALSGVMRHSAVKLDHLVASYAFVPWPRENGDMRPILSLGWTLNYEMFFYTLFALGLMLPLRRGFLAVSAAILALAALHPWVPARWSILSFWSEPILLEFLPGIVLARVYARGVRLNGWVALLLIVTALLAAPVTPPAGWRWIGWGAPAALIVTGAVLAPPLPFPRLASALSLAGAASYALYLCHPFSLNVVGVVWRKAHFGAPWLFVALAILASIAASVVVHLCIELPITRWLTGRTQRPRNPPRLLDQTDAAES